MRVLQCDADLLAAVLEAEHLFHIRTGAQLLGAVGQGVDHEAHLSRFEVGERRVMYIGEAHNLAATGVTAKAGKPVLEDYDLVARRRDLGVPAADRRAQRALVRRR